MVKATHVHQKKVGAPRYTGVYKITDIPHENRYHLEKTDSKTTIIRDGSQLKYWPAEALNLELPPKWDEHLTKTIRTVSRLAEEQQ